MATPLSPIIEEMFAVCCFHFSDDGFEYNDQEPTYEAAVRVLLSGIENITNIDVCLDSGFTVGGFLEPDFSVDGINSVFNPIPSGGYVSFDVLIPKRIQEEVFPFAPAMECEHFNVKIDYNYCFPITFVSAAINMVEEDNEFSQAAIVVREFMKRKAGSRSGVRFVCLGPSPFHSEFFVKRAAENQGVVIEKRPGYDVISYLYSGEQEARERFQIILGYILSQFYFSAYVRVAAMSAESDIFALLNKVMSRLTERNLIKMGINFVTSSNRKDIAQIYSDVFEVEEALESATDFMTEDKAKMPVEAQSSKLWEYVERGIGDVPRRLRERSSQILRLSEIFETSGSNNFAIVVAAIISAILTCGATLLATSMTRAGNEDVNASSNHLAIARPVNQAVSCIPHPH